MPSLSKSPIGVTSGHPSRSSKPFTVSICVGHLSNESVIPSPSVSLRGITSGHHQDLQIHLQSLLEWDTHHYHQLFHHYLYLGQVQHLDIHPSLQIHSWFLLD